MFNKLYFALIFIMYIMGISAYYHDSAAALLQDGHVIAAVEEERFSRKKFDDDFPKKVETDTLTNALSK